MESGLDVIKSYSVAEIFNGNKMDEVIAAIEKNARSIESNASTKEGRAAIRSNTYTVSKSSVVLDDIGKKFTEDLQRKKGAVDKIRRGMRSRLGALKEEIRLPLTKWEEVEAKRKEDINNRILALKTAPSYSQYASFKDKTKVINEYIERLRNTIIDDSYLEYITLAKLTRSDCIESALSKIKELTESENRRLMERKKEEEERRKREAKIASDAAQRERERLKEKRVQDVLRTKLLKQKLMHAEQDKRDAVEKARAEERKIALRREEEGKKKRDEQAKRDEDKRREIRESVTLSNEINIEHHTPNIKTEEDIMMHKSPGLDIISKERAEERKITLTRQDIRRKAEETVKAVTLTKINDSKHISSIKMEAVLSLRKNIGQVIIPIALLKTIVDLIGDNMIKHISINYSDST